MTPGELWWIVLASVGITALLGGAFIFAVLVAHRRLLAAAREFARKLLEAQEEERAWVARELHDDIVQRMFLLKGRVERSGAPPGDALTGALEDLDAVTEQLRVVARRMHPSALDHFGLEGGLKALAEDLADKERFEVRLEGAAPALPKDRALAVFRIVQEAIRNVQRHAGVSAATVRLRPDTDYLQVEIEDAGRGLDRSGTRPGLGVSSMKERARLAGGTLDLASPPSGGTRVTLRVPLAAGSRA
jgi:signal transduction histidine kinase